MSNDGKQKLKSATEHDYFIKTRFTSFTVNVLH